MKIEDLTDDEKYKCYIEFKTRCYFLYRTYQINKTLFEDNTDIYGDLDSPKIINSALIDHFLLQLHIVTDPANFGKNDKNLSVFFFLEWSWEPQVKEKLSKLAKELKGFVTFKREENPRHKMLAHWDVSTILNAEEPLGAFELGAEVEFFNNLNSFIQIMQEALGYNKSWNILTDKKADEAALVKIISSSSL
jgi:hypothetical protein